MLYFREHLVTDTETDRQTDTQDDYCNPLPTLKLIIIITIDFKLELGDSTITITIVFQNTITIVHGHNQISQFF